MVETVRFHAMEELQPFAHCTAHVTSRENALAVQDLGNMIVALNAQGVQPTCVQEKEFAMNLVAVSVLKDIEAQHAKRFVQVYRKQIYVQEEDLVMMMRTASVRRCLRAKIAKIMLYGSLWSSV